MSIDQCLIVGINPGVEYLWTDDQGQPRISWYISKELQSGIKELRYAQKHNLVRGRVEPRQMRHTEGNKKL